MLRDDRQASRPSARWAGAIALIVAAGLTGHSNQVRAQAAPTIEVMPMPAPAPAPVVVRTLDDLASLAAPQLEALYRQGGVGPVPQGKVRGLALYPDARFPRAKSRAARVAWQGKVFDPASNTATNRFFGVRVIKGSVYPGQSWLDGGPSLILDYQNMSRVYGNYRDEIRQIAPGLYLGLMYDRTTSPPGFKMYFAFADE